MQLRGAEEAGDVAGDVRGRVVEGGEGPAEQLDGGEAGEGLARKPPAGPQQVSQQPDYQHCSGTGYGHEDLLRGGQAAEDVHAGLGAHQDQFGQGGAAAVSRKNVTELRQASTIRMRRKGHRRNDARADFQRRLTA